MRRFFSSSDNDGPDIPMKVLDSSRDRKKLSSRSFGNSRFSFDENEAESLLIQEDTISHISDTKDRLDTRTVYVGQSSPEFCGNAMVNTKYNAFTFLPICLYEQFKYFYNMYFLLVALSQLVPQLKIGYMSTYIAPLLFVLAITLAKEAIDDLKRKRRDIEANSEIYEINGRSLSAKDIRVGDVVRVEKNQRVPADLILLETTSGEEAFIRTDQLDGETDWKLRVPCSNQHDQGVLVVDVPMKSVHEFYGTFMLDEHQVPLSVDNTLWANTILASDPVYGVAIYTGKDTRQSMNSSKARTKSGALEDEINFISKVLCGVVFILCIVLTVLQGLAGDWYISVFRYLILFSSIIPISLRVNLDMAKVVHSRNIERDPGMHGTVVRTTNIPEELGRIEFLLTDKTGTLTQNDMELKRLQIETMGFSGDSMDYVQACLSEGAEGDYDPTDTKSIVRNTVLALALCQNVTPTTNLDGTISYQAASPDEIAIVRWTSSIGLVLNHRDRHSMTLNDRVYSILQIFPFKSENKRMGIVIKSPEGRICFYLKGADVVMQKIVKPNVWLEEECGNMAREGLRTLVIARKQLTESDYASFLKEYNEASLILGDRREGAMSEVVGRYLECDMDLLGLTGVEDKLQKDVRVTLELLRNAGINIWMLTGDKVETARCIAVSSRLVSRGQYIHTVTRLSSREDAYNHLNVMKESPNCALLVDGESLDYFLEFMKEDFILTASGLPAVVACRCTPTQKAEITKLIRHVCQARVCCIGDGGNDVNMIQVANVGVGIMGKEGQQASLAADFSIHEFSQLSRLLVWHGRISYKQTSKLALFIIHRGLIISVCQAVYSVISKFEPIALFQGMLLVGYSTIYTMLPVFSIVYDRDVNEKLAFLFPELYKEMRENLSFSLSKFLTCAAVSVYQGIVIQLFTYLLIGFADEGKMLSVSFTCLILNELIMVALQINRWDTTIIMAELLTLLMYILSIPFLADYYDLSFLLEAKFYWSSFIILFTSLMPVWTIKTITQRLKPPSYAKLQR